MLFNCGVKDSWEFFGLQEINPVNLKGNQSWIFNGYIQSVSTDTEVETLKLWLPDENWLFGEDPDSGKDWKQEEKGTIENKMVGWHHRLQWTQAWASSRSWWWTGKPDVLQSMGSQRGRHDWAAELKWMNYSPPKQTSSPQKWKYLSTKFNFNLTKSLL